MKDATVLIADDHPLFRAALKQAVGHSFAQQLILEAEDVTQLKNLVESNPQLELLFLDLHMPGNDGFTTLMMLQNHYPDLIVVMVSSDDDPEMIYQAIDFGAAGFIPKSADLNTIQQAIDVVLEGETWLPADLPPRVNKDEQTPQQKLAKQLSELTPQQYKVLSMIADGQLNKQIAYDLDIKETTVKKHVSAILLKLGVNNRTLAGLAFQQLTFK
ncbi:response regulator [Psychrosphaera haliotis]|uniref:Response regulator n=1 Tax=Psychrosphaera haliotis TaxID=555083 RepID=A0A6N8F8J8_9GAMM|nr:response regulator transcription factor [Psychrosphaera haliotis]MDB2373429.1 response regulator transcription factor [Psychrosphaera haliotis]MUH71182.1 response regulator [Psychrosphaera haliotis]